MLSAQIKTAAQRNAARYAAAKVIADQRFIESYEHRLGIGPSYVSQVERERFAKLSEEIA